METGEVNIYGSSQLILGGQQTTLVSEAQHKSSRASHKLLQSRSVKEVSCLAPEEVVLRMLRSYLQKFLEVFCLHNYCKDIVNGWMLCVGVSIFAIKNMFPLKNIVIFIMLMHRYT